MPKRDSRAMVSRQQQDREASDQAPRRLGPRPLPLHLMAAGLTWASSRSALPLWNSGSLPLNGKLGNGKLGKGELAERAAALRASLDGTDIAVFAEAVEREVAGRVVRSEEHTSELQSLMRISYAV